MAKNKDEQSDLLLTELKPFITELKGASDHAVVLMTTSFMDQLLEQLLLRTLKESASREDDLFDGERPLSTFSAKIRMAYRLGLIDDVFAGQLHLFRKMRNEFAHEVAGCSLSHGPNRQRLDSICGTFRGDPFYEMLLDIVESASIASNVSFVAAGLTLIKGLLLARGAAERIRSTPVSVLTKAAVSNTRI